MREEDGGRTGGLLRDSAFGYPLAMLGPRNKFLGGYDVPGDAPVHLGNTRAEAEAGTPIHLAYGMSGEPAKSGSGVTRLTTRILDV